jgi:hypothetical protein
MRNRLIRRIELLENTVKTQVTEMPPEALEILRILGVKVPGDRPKDKVTAKKESSKYTI